MKPAFLSTSVGTGSTEASQVRSLFEKKRTKIRAWQSVVYILMMGISLSACSSMTWKEEVLLHDGNKIIVTRTHTYDPKGLREPFQPDPLKESMLTFTVPGTKQMVTWKSDYGRGNEDNLSLLMLDFLNSKPYIATYPKFCHGYNKWGRPNPPYVFFKYDGEWKRIPLAEFPIEFKATNVIVDAYNDKKIKEAERKTGFVTPDDAKEINKTLTKEYHTIIRTEIKTAYTACEEMIYYKGGWISPKGTFGRDFMDKISK